MSAKNDNEQWLPVVGYEELYDVSNLGRVRSIPNHRHSGLLILKQHPQKWGHCQVQLFKNGKRIRKYVHRLVLEAFVGPPIEGMEGCHNDGNPLNNCLINLRWDTPTSNQRDRFAHGTDVTGEKHGRAKLKQVDVVFIRKACAEGISKAELARRFTVSESCIRSAANSKNWKCVEA